MAPGTNAHFAAKHPAGTFVDPQISTAVRGEMIDHCISCAAVHAIAERIAVTPRDVGIAVDLLEARLLHCQLGLFGHGKPEKIVRPTHQIDPVLRARILAAATDGRLACAELWRIADDLKVARLNAAGACEALKIRIKPCQIGAF